MDEPAGDTGHPVQANERVRTCTCVCDCRKQTSFNQLRCCSLVAGVTPKHLSVIGVPSGHSITTPFRVRAFVCCATACWVVARRSREEWAKTVLARTKKLQPPVLVTEDEVRGTGLIAMEVMCLMMYSGASGAAHSLCS